jgi:hypothetical protein
MKKTLGVVAVSCLMVIGCASVSNQDGVRAATLKAIGAEQVALNSNGAKPAGMDSLVALTNLSTHLDKIEVTSPTEATALATYKYAGRFNTDGGERTGVLTVQRKLRFTKSGSEWVPAGAEEVARSNDWTGGNGTKSTVQ